MNLQLLRGKLVYLTVEDPQIMADAFSRWSLDTEYWRLLTSDAALPRSSKSIKEWLEKDLGKENPKLFLFAIRRLEDHQLIGQIDLDIVLWTHRESFIGIGLGERDYWGKGYGTDAMRVILNYAFSELNLDRVSLNVFDYNPRARRSYEKAGFEEEGRSREFLLKDGKRYDLIFMGILRSEWEELVRQEKLKKASI